MTRYVLDIASYQGALKLADVQRAEFTAVNLKISHGLGTTTVHPNLSALVAEARTRRLGIGTFHWLIGNHPGAAQADYAYGRMKALGLTAGTAHTVDVEEQPDADAESPPTWQHVVDYVTRMKALLGRPVAVYTGDWWWTAPGRNWNGATLTPYLWAAPNDGYLGSYPGDTSPHWSTKRAPTPGGWGGWTTLAIMQYAVAPLFYPDGGQGTINVSKSAVRDERVWRALTGGDQLVTTQAEFNTLMDGWYAARMGATVARLLATGDAILTNVKADDQDLAETKAAIEQQVRQAASDIVSGLAASTMGTEDLADLLRAALGDRAGQVGQALQADPNPAGRPQS